MGSFLYLLVTYMDIIMDISCSSMYSLRTALGYKSNTVIFME